MLPILLLLACGGGPDPEIADRLKAECAYADQSSRLPEPQAAALPELAAPARPLGLTDAETPRLRITSDRLMVGFGSGRLAPILPPSIPETLNAAAERAGLEGWERLALLVDADVSGARLSALLERVAEADVGALWFVARTSAPPEPPAWLDPDHGAALSASLRTSPGQESALIREALQGLLGGPEDACGQAVGEVLKAIPEVGPDQKCYLLAGGLPDALTRCPTERGLQIATTIQASRGDLRFLTAAVVPLGGGAPKLDPDARWGDQIAALQERYGE